MITIDYHVECITYGKAYKACVKGVSGKATYCTALGAKRAAKAQAEAICAWHRGQGRKARSVMTTHVFQ